MTDMACGKCGGPLAQDPSAADEFFCRQCGARYYTVAPDTHGKTANPLACPECGVRVYGFWTSKAVICGDCHASRAVATILRPTPDVGKQAIGQRTRGGITETYTT